MYLISPNVANKNHSSLVKRERERERERENLQIKIGEPNFWKKYLVLYLVNVISINLINEAINGTW